MYQRAMIHVVPPRRSCQQPYHRWARHARTRTTQVIRTHRTVRALAIGNTSRHFIDVTFMSNAFWNPWEQIFKVYFNGYVSSGLLHSSTSFIDRQLTKRRRDQYTDIDSLNPKFLWNPCARKRWRSGRRRECFDGESSEPRRSKLEPAKGRR